MPFTLPTFNIAVNRWTGGAGPPAAPVDTFMGNLSTSRRIYDSVFGLTGIVVPSGLSWLLLPSGTLIIPLSTDPATIGDLVEAPAGSGYFYIVLDGDYAGRGFGNEHLCMQVAKWTVGIAADWAPNYFTAPLFPSTM
jgi:hypothetical protein